MQLHSTQFGMTSAMAPMAPAAPSVAPMAMAPPADTFVQTEPSLELKFGVGKGAKRLGYWGSALLLAGGLAYKFPSGILPEDSSNSSRSDSAQTISLPDGVQHAIGANGVATMTLQNGVQVRVKIPAGAEPNTVLNACLQMVYDTSPRKPAKGMVLNCTDDGKIETVKK